MFAFGVFVLGVILAFLGLGCGVLKLCFVLWVYFDFCLCLEVGFACGFWCLGGDCLYLVDLLLSSCGLISVALVFVPYASGSVCGGFAWLLLVFCGG